MPTFPATLDSLAAISAYAVELGVRAGLDEHASWQVQLAIDEAASNIIQHAYSATAPGSITINARVEPNTLTITLHDHGQAFDPNGVPTPDITSPLEERQSGGLGIYLMRRLMDDVAFSFDPTGGNVLTLTKRINPAPDIAIITLSGRLDAATTDRAIAAARATIPGEARRVLVDMTDVTFLSSSGLRALLLLRRELQHRDGEIHLCGLRPTVREVFVVTGFTQVFQIHASRTDALAVLRAPRA